MMYAQDIRYTIDGHRQDYRIAMNNYNQTGDINQYEFAQLRMRQIKALERQLPFAEERPLTPDQAYARNVVVIRW